jgi:hypothetical protein
LATALRMDMGRRLVPAHLILFAFPCLTLVGAVGSLGPLS